MEESAGEEAASSSTVSKNNSYSSGNDNSNLQDSEFTVDSLENEPEGSGAGSWFGGMGTDFLHCLTDNVSPVVSGMATLVHNTAVAVANEIAQLERDGELEAEVVAAAAERPNKHSRGEETGSEAKAAVDCNMIVSSSSFDSTVGSKSESLILPWEICQESSPDSTQTKEDDEEIHVYFTDMELMKKIFVLSRQESTFLGPFSKDSPEGNASQTRNVNGVSLSSYSSTFVMDEPRIKLICRLLDIDENLTSNHSRLTGDTPKSWDTFFWKNYFFHCEEIRADELCRREQHNCMTRISTKSSVPSKLVNGVSNLLAKENDTKSGKGNDDDESLIPVDSDTEGHQHDDDFSYVIQSAPNTADSLATTRSIEDDLVLVDTQERIGKNNASANGKISKR